MQNRLHPRDIPNNFRFQFLIEDELTKAKELLKTPEKLTSKDYADIALVYMEVGDKINSVKYAEQALTMEEQIPLPNDNEAVATAKYVSANRARDRGDIDTAKELIQESFEKAQSPWLISNIYRCRGLIFLKEESFLIAAGHFQTAIDYFEDDNSAEALHGSLPALKNYVALASAKALLKCDELTKYKIEEVFKKFQAATALYETMFAERQISDAQKEKSHDWQSHQFHRGMVLCEIAEKYAELNIEFYPIQKAIALKLLLTAYEGRIANKADDQRLGDVCKWISRAYKLLGDTDNAAKYSHRAESHSNAHEETNKRALAVQNKQEESSVEVKTEQAPPQTLRDSREDITQSFDFDNLQSPGQQGVFATAPTSSKEAPEQRNSNRTSVVVQRMERSHSQ